MKEYTQNVIRLVQTLEAGEAPFSAVSRFLLAADRQDLMVAGPVLARVIPELEPLLGFDQRSPHHAYDLYTHVAHVVSGLPANLTLRWAALLHDIGKIPTFTRDETGRGHFYGHASAGAEMADRVLQRLGAPDSLRQQAALLIERHMKRLIPDEQLLRNQADCLGWETLENLLALQEADMDSKGTGNREESDVFQRVRLLLTDLRREAESCIR